MENYSVKILDLAKYRDSDSQTRISVPLWFLDLVSEAESCAKVDSVINLMNLSEEDELCKRKSIHLAIVRKRVIEHDSKD